MNARIHIAATAVASIAATGTLTLAASAGAQHQNAALDRTVAPTPGLSPELRIPTWTTTTLANGAQLVVSEKHALPLVTVQVNFIGGARQYEPANETGLAGIVASMLSEGTTHRTGDQLSNDLQLLGTFFGTGIGAESGQIAFEATKDKVAPTLAILADVLENPIFPEPALERIKARALINLTQARDRTSSIAAIVFPKVLYTDAQPYGRSASAASINAITRDDVLGFYRAYFQPAHAVVTVVGDVDAAVMKREIDGALAGWKAGGSMPSFDYPTPPAPKSSTIYLVDKPGAAQSSFALGEVGPPENTPDYYALRVMNTILGGMFQSRLNHDIREVKGYSYGVGSRFAFGRGPGAFRASGDIVTAKTDSALIEFMKQLRDIRGPVPPTDDEMAQAKASLVQSLPESFADVSGVNASIASIYTQGLPTDYYQQLIRGVKAVTKDDVVRVAQKYIDPDHLALVIVGDRAVIEAPLAATGIAPIVRLDLDGKPIANPVRP
jgi:zinc protease